MKKLELLAMLYSIELNALVLKAKDSIDADSGEEKLELELALREFGYHAQSSAETLDVALVHEILDMVDACLKGARNYFYEGVQRALEEEEVNTCAGCQNSNGEPCSFHG